MESQLAKSGIIAPDLSEFLKILHSDIEIKSQHRRKVMIVDIVNHINCLARGLAIYDNHRPIKVKKVKKTRCYILMLP